MDARSRAQTDASVLKRTSSVRCCAPVEDSLMDIFETSHSMPASIFQHCRCNSNSYYGLNRNVFSGKRAAPVVYLRYFTLKLLFLISSSGNIIFYIRFMCYCIP